MCAPETKSLWMGMCALPRVYMLTVIHTILQGDTGSCHLLWMVPNRFGRASTNSDGNYYYSSSRKTGESDVHCHRNNSHGQGSSI